MILQTEHFKSKSINTVVNKFQVTVEGKIAPNYYTINCAVLATSTYVQSPAFTATTVSANQQKKRPSGVCVLEQQPAC